ncbi:ATP-binding protein [Gillisia sp. CAL575]|uniref:ATP-binding protein n=1 Tax=Gillisia sp. CAL575 TaxID=985255 RepID=UPI00039D961E|nr:ATP-binding protein [Gillisia sp. CAL575]
MKSILKKIGSKLWEMFLYYLKKLIDYKFRKRSVFWWGIKIATLSLITELVCIQTEAQFSSLFNWVNTNYGEGWEIFFRTIIDLFFAGGLGYSVITISIKLYLITLFSILEWNKDKGFNFQWKNIWIWEWNWNVLIDVKSEINFLKIENNYSNIDWEPTNEWFSDINKNQLSSIGTKYNKDLHIKSKVEEDILSSIRLSQNQLHVLKEKVDEAINGVNQLETEINELFKVNTIQDVLVLDEASIPYKEFTELKDGFPAYKTSFQELNVLIDNNKTEDVKNYIIPKLLEVSYNVDNINEIINEERLKLFIKKEEDGKPFTVNQKRSIYNFIYKAYRAHDDLIYLFSQIEILRNKIFHNFYLVQAKAGIGKTHFSINLERILSNESFKSIIITGSSFSGENNLHAAFKNILELPDTITFENSLAKINDYSEKLNTKTIIIIDGINETTNLLQGFSTIWAENLELLCNRIHQYNNLVLVITCRETYLKKIDLNTGFNKNIFQLEGFEDDIKRLQAIENYFDHYKIICNEVRRDNPNLDFFELPLILGVFCEMTNPEKLNPKTIQLGQYTYEEILRLFVETQSEKVASLLDRPSKTPILNAIDRSSEKFKTEFDASLDFDEFLSVTDNKAIDDILESKSIGIKLLDEELLFLKEYIPGFSEERVLHIFQHIGGYLIAENILKEFINAKDLVDSEYYKTYLNYNPIEDDNKTHQLVTDILKFLVIGYSRKKDDLINYTEDQLVINYTWEFLFQNPEIEEKEDVARKLKPFLKKRVGWEGLLDESMRNFVNPKSSFNMFFISGQLKDLPQFQFDLIWTRFIFDRWYSWDEFLDNFFKDNDKIDENKIETIKLKLELVIWLLESTSRNFRDKATLVLLDYATKNPQFIFNKIFEYSNVSRPYIYERLAAICYGVCLRKQNDTDFINGLLKDQVQSIYNLQFGSVPAAPSFNYIVIDSLKHIVDLALYKEVFSLEDQELKSFNNYNFNPEDQWQKATEDDTNYVASIVNSWHNSSDSDPLRGDFVHYTIPRLQERGETGPDNRLTATANIYKRIIELGYVTKDNFESIDKKENDFYYGNKPYGFEGKLDRLGKKYSWIAFFDYAGHLLNQGLLNVWSGEEDERIYNRLGDVEIEVSNPKPIIYGDKLFKVDLFKHKNDNELWTGKSFYEESKLVWNQDFNEGNFTLLKGYLEQKLDESYDVRSFILIESFLVKKDEIISNVKNIINQEINWSHDLDTKDYLSHVYFGELYWTDNIPKGVISEESIPTLNDNGEIEHIAYTIEATTTEYVWESNSEIFKTLSGNIPSPNIGKHLNLKANAKDFQIINEDGSLAFKSYQYLEPDLIRQNLDYLRTDLLKKYMEDKDLVLLYQIKQHTYDRITGEGNGDFRGMQFFFPKL